MRMTKAQKAAEKAYDDAFRKLGQNIQFDIMDLGKMHKEANAAVATGKTMEQAVAEAIAKYRKN
jgi:hypothetical protein